MQLSRTRRLGCHRSTIYRACRRMGIQGKRPGPRAPELTQEQQRQVLELLQTGKGTARVARELNLRPWAVRQIAETHHIRRRTQLTPEQQQQIEWDVLHRMHALPLSRKYGIPYKLALKIAKETLSWVIRRYRWNRPTRRSG